MPTVILQQVSNSFARKNAGGTLEKPVGLRFIAKYLSPEQFESLNKVSSDGSVRIWGAKLERSHQFIKVSPRDSFVLFRRSKQVFAHGVVAETTFNEALAEMLWGRDSDGQTWPFILFLKNLVLVQKEAARFNLLLGRKENDNWQGMTALYVKESPRLQAYFASQLDGEA